MHQKLSKKIEPILKYTVALYIEEANPISSSYLITKYGSKLNCSSAKVRYIMNELEASGYLKKSHNSSGRTPTVLGLDYYAKYLSRSWDQKMKEKVDKILMQKHIDIDHTVTEAAKIITEMAGITLVTNEITKDALLKSIDIVPIDLNKATVVLVISTGEVFSKIITFETKILISDLKIALRIFKERLIDCKLKELAEKVSLLKDLLAESVNDYQSIIDSIVNQVFNTYLKQQEVNKRIYGKNNIILSKQIQREDLTKMINLIEENSIWEKIQDAADADQNIKITVDSSGTFMSKRIENNSKITEISAVGATNSDFDAMKAAINVLDSFYKKLNNEEENND